VLGEPRRHRLPALIAQADVFSALAGPPLARGLHIGPKPAQRLARHIACRSSVDDAVEA